MYLFGENGGPGYNRITDNADEGVNLIGGFANIGYASASVHGGYNAIFGNGGVDIYNTQGEIPAHYTYWGGAASCNCYGAVDDSYPLYSDYTDNGDSGADRTQVPSKNEGDLLMDMHRIRSELELDNAGSSPASLLTNLYALQLLDEDDQLEQKKVTMGVIKRWRQKLDLAPSLSTSQRKAAEQALVLEIRELLFEEHYAAAERLLDQYGSLVEWEEYQRQLLLNRVSLHERAGRLDDALSSFETFKEEAPPGHIQEGLYGIVEDALIEAGAAPGKQGNSYLKPEAPEEFSVSSAFPNPSKEGITFSISLPEAANVEAQVFNILGRRVSTVLNAGHGAGIHEVTFDAGELSSGTYVLRVRLTNAAGKVRTQTQILSLLR